MQRNIQISTIDKLAIEKTLLLQQTTTAEQQAMQAVLQTRLDQKLKALDAEIYSGKEGQILRRAQLYQSPANTAKQLLQPR